MATETKEVNVLKNNCLTKSASVCFKQIIKKQNTTGTIDRRIHTDISADLPSRI